MSQTFDWLIPDLLGVCPNPSVARLAAAELAAQQVRLLINLYEAADPVDLLAELGAESLHLPVRSAEPPSQEQLDVAVEAIEAARAQGIRVAVHCQAGLGRSGTLLAAYLVSQGATADEAMARVRAVRPGSIETDSQEAAVHWFAQRLAGRVAARV
jgi:atypical dual specificity phosphatase